MTAAWGCCPAPRHPGELLNPQRRVPGACRPRRGRTTWRATRRRARAALARRGPARGLPRGLVPCRRASRAAAYVAAPRFRQPCWRRAVSSAGRTGTGRTHRPPPFPSRMCVRLDAGNGDSGPAGGLRARPPPCGPLRARWTVVSLSPGLQGGTIARGIWPAPPPASRSRFPRTAGQAHLAFEHFPVATAAARSHNAVRGRTGAIGLPFGEA